MRSFDLTFTGAVLPDHDPGKVKRDLGELFSIEDEGLLEAMFSGKTVILRHHLDRKTAADYFRTINALGADVALVTTPHHRSMRGDDTLVLPQTQAQQAGPLAEDPVQVSSEEAALMVQAPAKLEESTVDDVATDIKATPTNEARPASDLPVPETEADEAECARDAQEQQRIALAQAQARKEREKQEEAERQARAKQESERREVRLQRLRQNHEKIASEELDKIEQLCKANAAGAEQERAVLVQAKHDASEAHNCELADIEERITACREITAASLAQLDELMEESRSGEEQDVTRIDQQIESAWQSAEDDIKALEEQIEQVRNRANDAIASLKDEREEVHTSAQSRRQSLLQEREENEQALQNQLADLSGEQHSVRGRCEARLEEIQQQVGEVTAREQSEAERLTGMRAEIEARRNQGIADIEQSLNELRRQTGNSLRQEQVSTWSTTAANEPDSKVAS